MLQAVDIGRRSLAAYAEAAPAGMLDELEEVAAGLRGLRVLHLSATPYGGGVSELLRSVVPLLNDLGIVSEWHIASGNKSFFDVTKTIHNGLQGSERSLTGPDRETYLATTRRNARALDERYDVVFVHDPQPAAILEERGRDGEKWIWRCHIDTSTPNADTWAFVRGFLGEYDAAVFTMPEFVPPNFPIDRVSIIPPAIDPLSPKNRTLDPAMAREILEWIGVDTEAPFVTQISRFDPWKDPLGVIEAYRLAREEVPGLQLALAGSMALDDPEGWGMYETVAAECSGDPLIHVFTNLTGIGNIEVNAFQSLAQVVIQKSVREGFGLVVSEAMWKATPVVAGRAGGIPLQLADGVGGILVDSTAECAAATVALLENPERAAELAHSGHERVRTQFLLPRLLLDELRLIRDVIGEREPAFPLHFDRDPVCGMSVDVETAVRSTWLGQTYCFCSGECKSKFDSAPERYVTTTAALRKAGDEPRTAR
ncbi:MAG: glycosyltransferase [Solirubrobacterales bacterium]